MPLPSAAKATTTVAVVLLVVCVTVSVDALRCSCNNGNVDVATPQCVCSCFRGYLQPRCLYTASDMVPMEVWVRVPASQFLASAFIQTLSWALPVTNTSHIKFVYALPHNDINKTVVYISLRGDRAQQLTWDFYSNNSYLAKAGIESVWENIPTVAPPILYGATLSVYRSSDGKILITVEGVMWLIAALVVVAVVLGFDSCFYGNTEEEVEEKMIENHPALSNLVSGSLVPNAGGPSDHNGGPEAHSENPLAAPKYLSSSSDPRKIFNDRVRR